MDAEAEGACEGLADPPPAEGPEEPAVEEGAVRHGDGEEEQGASARACAFARVRARPCVFVCVLFVAFCLCVCARARCVYVYVCVDGESIIKRFFILVPQLSG